MPEDVTPRLSLLSVMDRARADGNSAANKDRKHMAAFWEYAVRFYGFPPNPFRHVEKLPENSEPHYVPPVEDFWKIYAVADEVDRAMLLSLLYTGGRRSEPLRYAFQVLTPTEETPLAATLLAQADGPFGSRPVGTPFLLHSEYLWAICALDPAIVRVELTMNYTYRLVVGDGYGDPLESDPVTAQAQPVADGVWLARVRLPNPLEGRSGGYSANHFLRAYDADGQLVYDSGLS